MFWSMLLTDFSGMGFHLKAKILEPGKKAFSCGFTTINLGQVPPPPPALKINFAKQYPLMFIEASAETTTIITIIMLPKFFVNYHYQMQSKLFKLIHI